MGREKRPHPLCHSFINSSTKHLLMKYQRPGTPPGNFRSAVKCGPGGQNFQNNTKMLVAFFAVDICTDGYECYRG